MPDSTALLAQMRLVAGAGGAPQADARPANAWMREGLARAQLHEIYAGHVGEGASVAGFAVACILAAKALPILWLRTEAAEREGGRLHATGLVELGLTPDAVVLGVVADERALLQAASDGARCAGLGTVVVEAWGRAPAIDLTVTRRLMLAAETSGVTVLLLRIGAEPAPSAAATRWGVAAAPSNPLEADAPGYPAFDIELQRRRGGPSGQRWRVEWNRDAYRFDTLPKEDSTALPGAGLSLAAGGTPPQHPPAPVRRA